MVFELAPFRHVAGDLDEADQLRMRVTKRPHHYTRPESRAVLAHTPAFRLVPADSTGDGERPLWLAARAILFGEKSRKVTADDLGRRVSLDPLGSRVPACHHPIGIEPVNGIVDDALDEHRQVALVLGQAGTGRAQFAGSTGNCDLQRG